MEHSTVKLLLLLTVLGVSRDVSFADSLDEQLLMAVQSDNPSRVQVLLQEGASPNATYAKGSQTAYEMAVLAGYSRLAEELSSKGADKMGITDLMLASRQGNPTIVKYQIQQRANINQTDKRGNTALLYSILADSIPCTQVLLENGGMINKQNREMATPIFSAQSVGPGFPI
jgi:ankyrin repeat protein